MSVLGFSLCLAVFGSASGAPGNGRALYKWVDSKGEVHYGDHIPPEYASQETQIINSRGVEIEHLDAQKTPEQQAVDDQKKATVQAALNRDRNLLTAYGSVAEIERLRDTRLALISDQIRVRSDFLDTLNRQMKRLSTNGMHFRPYSDDPKAPPMTDQAAQDLVHLGNDIHTQQQNLKQLRGDESTMKQQFESDIARFKELKHIQ
jgi:Domain of unknown function (DUF4124)